MNEVGPVERLAVLAGRSWVSEVLHGGLNNATRRVRTTDGRSPELDLVVRQWPADDPLDHRVEVAAAHAAEAAGVGPVVRDHRPADRLLVLDHVAGHPLSATDLLEDAVLERVVGALHRLHAARADVPSLELLALAEVPGSVRQSLVRDPEPLVLCHNDLVPSNLIDDGQRIALIDFEYAGLGEPSAELAGLAVGAGFDAERVATLTRLYYGSASAHLLARVQQWQVVVRRIWSDWARERGHAQWVLDE